MSSTRIQTIHHYFIRIISSRSYYIISLFICYFLAFLINLRYVLLDNYPLSWDQASHVSESIGYLQYFHDHNWHDFFYSYHFYPPFLYHAFGFFFFIIPNYKLATIFFNFSFIAFMLITLFVTHQKEKPPFIVAISLFSLLTSWYLNIDKANGFFGFNTWELMLDVPTAILFFSFLLFFQKILKKQKVGTFSSLSLSILFTATAGSRTQSLSFLFIPTIIFIAFMIKKKAYTPLLAFFLIPLFYLQWYEINWQKIQTYSELGVFFEDQNATISLFHTFLGAMTYIKMIARFFYQPVILVVFVVIFFSIHGIKKIKLIQSISFTRDEIRKNLSDNWLIFLLLITNLLFYSAIPNIQLRYIAPSLLLLSYLVARILSKYLLHYQYFLIFTFLIILNTYKLFEFFPKAYSHFTTYDFVENFQKQYNFPLTSYFFEIDSSTLNINNINMLYFTNFKKDRFIIANNPNKYASIYDQKACYFSEQSLFLMRYKKLNENSNQIFEENCENTIKQYSLIKKEAYIDNTLQEKIEIYERQN